MRAFRLAGIIVLTSLLVAGCKQSRKGAEPVAPPTQTLTAPLPTADELRAAYLRADSTARIGVVIAVNAEFNLAAVAQAPVQDFHVGDILTFIDRAEKIIANGTLRVIDKDILVVKCEPTPDGRVPAPGDLAIKVK